MYYEGFRNYFDHSEAQAYERARQRQHQHQHQQRNQVANRSLIGQQPGLNTTNDLSPVLNATTRSNNRTRGWSEMASDVVVTESSLTDPGSSRGNQQVTPRRRLAPNDGRS